MESNSESSVASTSDLLTAIKQEPLEVFPSTSRCSLFNDNNSSAINRQYLTNNENHAQQMQNLSFLNSGLDIPEFIIKQESVEVLPSTSNASFCETLNSTTASTSTNDFTVKDIRGRDIDDDIGEYYFESDHLALKGNKDYHLLLKTVAILEAQRMKAIRDLDRLYEAQAEALADPIGFVEKLQRNENLNLPDTQNIVNVPNIDWDQYLININPENFKHRHMTRRKQDPEIIKLDSYPTSDQSNSTTLVRGRIFDESKSVTFNKLWTVEEQKLLEELLIKFPPEEVEARRWEKIAQALGNRTPQQVASRVQKYFIKLTKAGLPVPGRIPNVNNHAFKKGNHRHQRHNRFLFQPSTFFASYEPPVFMSEYDDDKYSSCNVSSTSSIDDDHVRNEKNDELSDDESIQPEMRDTPEYRELIYLMKIKKEKERKASGLAQHVGFKCDRCESEPIIGTRWHCVDCPTSAAVDFCDDCVDCLHETKTHSCNHRLEPIRTTGTTPYIDNDYTRFMPGDYNYLDPNYMPAT